MTITMLRQNRNTIMCLLKTPFVGLLSTSGLAVMAGQSLRRKSSYSGRPISKVDRSLVPEVSDDDLEEHFVRGEGPGGQNVNKRSTCVVLRHLPTGIQVRCHQKRTQEENRTIARQMLRDRLDQLHNGDNSVAAQLQRLDQDKRVKREQRATKLRDMKNAFRQRENLDGE